MLINTPQDLNKFIALFGYVDPDKIVKLLSEHKVIVSPVIAKLLQDKAA